MWTTLIIIFICSFLAFTISAICGGGASLMLIPILGSLLPMNQVPAALSIGTFSSSTSRIILFKKNICWHIVKYFVPFAIPAVWLGAWLLKFLNPLYLEILMGFFLISNLPFILKKSKEVETGKKPANWVLGIIGFLAGFLSGLTGVVGLLFNKFYLRYGLTKEEIVATRAANEIILHLIKIVLYTLFGLLTVKVISIGIVIALAAILSSLSMKWILPMLSELLFNKIGYFAMVLSGFILLTKATSTLMLEKKINFTTSTKSKGLETKLKWQKTNYALEFTYDEGFEFELVTPIKDLTISQQEFVKSKHKNADKIVIEAVYTINELSYEAYYFKDNRLIDKIDFD